MNFEFRAVTKKERIQKTLILGIPFTIISAVIFSFILRAVDTLIPFTIVYYIALYAYSVLIGRFVKKIGKGTTVEFLIIAGIFALFGHIIAEFFSLYFDYYQGFGFIQGIKSYFSHFIFALPSALNSYSLVVKGFAVAVAVQEAITVRSAFF